MFKYYKLDAIPIILDNFKVENIIISGLSDKKTVNHIIKYCNDTNAKYIAIDSNDNFGLEFIKNYTLNVLPDLKNYDAIFINDDPNWYTVFNELNIIKQNNDEFPLVFICHNRFPYKRRDSYIDPSIIPVEFRNDFSKKLVYKGFDLSDGLFHATNDTTSKNGVLTALEDFLSENPSIGLANFKLFSGITVLYPKNTISQIRFGKIDEGIQEYILEYDDISDSIMEAELLTYNLFNLETSMGDMENIKDFIEELDEKERIIKDYENKIKLNDIELDYKNSQIDSYNSQLNLKDSQIKNAESKLVNRENELKDIENQLQNTNSNLVSLKEEISEKEKNESQLNNQLADTTSELNSLKIELNKKESSFRDKEENLNNQLSLANSKIDSLREDISEKENIVSNLNNQLQSVENQIKKNSEQLNNKDTQLKLKESELKDKDIQLKLKESELEDKDALFSSMKRQYAQQLSKLETKEYCISCYKEEINNTHVEIQYFKNDNLTRKLLSPFAYLYLLFKSNRNEILINFKLYNTLKNSECFDIGYYLSNNDDLRKSKWCKYFSPELHYVCNGFNEERKFNKKYFNRDSKKDLLDYILKC